MNKFLSKFNKASKTNNFMIFFTSSSNIIANGLTIISGLIALKWLLPMELGEFNTFTVISGYIVLAHIGLPAALSRDLPYLFGKNERNKALNLAAVAKFWSILVSIILSIVGILVIIYYLSIAEYKIASGIFVIIAQVWQGLYVMKYIKILYRTNKDFNKLALISLAVAIVSFLSIYFIYKYGFYGLCLRAVVIVIFDFILSWLWRPIKVAMKWNLQIFKDMLKIGFPMFLVTNVYSKWPLVQRTIILLMLGTNALGLFTVVFVIGNAYSVFTSSMGNVLYPTMMMEWGKGKSIGHIIKENLVKPLSLIVILFLIVTPILWYALPIAINYFLPKYSEINDAAQWMVLTGLISMFSVFGVIYNVINMQKQRLFMYLSGVLGWLVVLIIGYWSGVISFELFPQALLVGYLIMTVINIIFIRNIWTKTQII